MKCIVCDGTVQEIGVLHRINEKGVPGVWVCEAHRTHIPDKGVADVVNALLKANQPMKGAMPRYRGRSR